MTSKIDAVIDLGRAGLGGEIILKDDRCGMGGGVIGRGGGIGIIG